MYFTKVEPQSGEGPHRNVRQEFYPALLFVWVHKQGVNTHTHSQRCVEWGREFHHVYWSMVQYKVGKQVVPVVSQSNLSKLTLLNLSRKHYRAKEIKVSIFAMDLLWPAVVFYVIRDKKYNKTNLWVLYLLFSIHLGLILFSYRICSDSLGLRVGEASEIISFSFSTVDCYWLFSTASASQA